MKYRAFLFWLMLAATANAVALEPKIEIFEQYDNLRVVAFIDPQAIEDSPEWNPDMAPPPLSVGDAIERARAYNKTGAVEEIEIRQIPKHAGKWHYLLKIADEAKKSGHDVYVVLMNGKVIPAIIEPQSYK